jgi:hypothetical protein
MSDDVQLGKTWGAFKEWMERLWDSLSVSQSEKDIWNTFAQPIEYATKKTGIDAGYLGQRAFDDDYWYVCTKEGEAGVAIWKKSMLFNT